MIVVETVPQPGRVETLGQGISPARSGWSTPVTVREAFQRSEAARLLPTPVQQAAAAKRARQERIKQEEALARSKQPTTPLQIEARRRVTTYKAESKFQGDRRRFENELRKLPVALKLKVRELIKAHGSYESLPGYSAFAAGRVTLRDMVAGLEDQHKQLREWQAGQRAARVATLDVKDEIIADQIRQERTAKVARQVQQDQQAQLVALRLSAQRQASRAKRQEKEAEKKAAADALKAEQSARRRVISIEKKAAFDVEVEAHPFQPGSPPVSAAIAEVAAQMGLSPGDLDPTTYSRFSAAVFSRAQVLRKKLYYYKQGRSSKYWYNTSRTMVTSLLTAAGYRSATRTPEVPRPRPAQLPARAADTGTPGDPVIQESLRQAMTESGLRSGQEITITDIVAFARLVTAKAARLAQTEGKTVQSGDITKAIIGRLRFMIR